jgi:hypothetical protein
MHVEVAEPPCWINVQSAEELCVMCVLCTPRKEQIETALEQGGLPVRFPDLQQG